MVKCRSHGSTAAHGQKHARTHARAHTDPPLTIRVTTRKRSVFMPATTDVCSSVSWLARGMLKRAHAHTHTHTHLVLQADADESVIRHHHVLQELRRAFLLLA